METLQRPRLQRSVSERPALLRRSSSLYGLLTRVPSIRHGWSNGDVMGGDYISSGEDEPNMAPPSPTVSPEEAKRARKKKLQSLFKQGVSKVMKERAMEMNKTAKLASLYTLDAFAGRLQHGMAAMSTRPWYIFAAFRLQISREWLWCIIAASLAHSMLVFVEPNKHGEEGEAGAGRGGWLSGGTLRALEALFIAVYAVDVLLKVAYMGLKNYWKKPWQKLMVLITLVLALDASGLFAVRFARFLRPAILSLRTRSIRRFYAVVSNMLPGFLRVCLPVLFFLLLSASFAALSFGRAKAEFENSMSAGYAIWILMVSADNYGSLVDEPSQHPAYIPFVVMVIIVGSMFLLSLLLGVTYDVFIEHTTEQVKNERLKELRGLNKAFAIMDPEGTGKLSMVVWDRFLHHVMPRTTQQERALYFEIASGFADELDVLGFMDLRQVLSYRFVNVNAVERQGKRLKWEKKPRWLVRVLETMEGALHTRWWRNIVAAIVLLDCLFLPYGIPHQGPGERIARLTTACGAVLLVDQLFQWAEWMRQGSGLGPLKLPGKSFHTKVAGIAVLAHTAVVAVIFCPPLLSLTCSGASLARSAWSSMVSSLISPGHACSAEGCLDDGAGGLGGAGGWGSGGADGGWCPVGDEQFYAGSTGERRWGVGGGGGEEGGGEGMCLVMDWCMDGMVALAYTMRLMRCWRLVTLNDTLHAHVDTFFSVVPVFAQTLSFALIVAYAFALGGMQFFADKASAFKDAGTALKTTLQLFVGVDFSAVVEDTVNEVGHSAFLYFALYHVVGVLIVFNLLTAIMIQLYGEALNEKSRQNLEDQRKADQLLQDSLYEHNQKQRVLRLWGRNLTQRAAKLNVTRATQVNTGREARRVLGSATKSVIPTEEELTACQSYAKVDLLRALQEKTRGDRSLRTFERSMYQKLKSSDSHPLNHQKFADGEVIYQRGDFHHCCYFVNRGVVRLEGPDGPIETKENGEMFGEEALVASLPMCSTATADGPVECVGIDRATFTETHGTLENLGHIFLRLQRSGSLSGMDTPMSDGSGRRFLFSQGTSSRGSRMGGMMRSGDLDGNGSEMRSERWRSNRNLPSFQYRSSRDEGDGNGGSFGGGGDAQRRRGNSNASDRSNNGRLGSRGDSFARGNSVRSSASSGTGAAAGAGGSGSEARASESGTGSNTTNGSRQDRQPSKTTGLFTAKPAPSMAFATAGTVSDGAMGVSAHTGESNSGDVRSTRRAPVVVPDVGTPGASRSLTSEGSGGSGRSSSAMQPGSGEGKQGLSAPRDPAAAGGDGGLRLRMAGRREFPATLQRDYGRVGSCQMDASENDSDKGGEGVAEAEVESAQRSKRSLGAVSVSNPEEIHRKVEVDALKKNDECETTQVTTAASTSAVIELPPISLPMMLNRSRTMSAYPSDDELQADPPPADTTCGVAGAADAARAPVAGASDSGTVLTADPNDDGSGGVMRWQIAAAQGRRSTGSTWDRPEALWRSQHVIHESLHEKTTRSSDASMDCSPVSPSSRNLSSRGASFATAGGGVGDGSRRDSESLEFSLSDGDGGSLELSPSAAPVRGRRGAMFSTSYDRRSSLSRQEDGKGGSGKSSAWSTNSPSPVMRPDQPLGMADEEHSGEFEDEPHRC